MTYTNNWLDGAFIRRCMRHASSKHGSVPSRVRRARLTCHIVADGVQQVGLLHSIVEMGEATYMIVVNGLGEGTRLENHFV